MNGIELESAGLGMAICERSVHRCLLLFAN